MIRYKRVNARSKKGLEEAERLQEQGWTIYAVGWYNIDFYKKTSSKGQVNILGIVGLVYLVLMGIVLLCMF